MLAHRALDLQEDFLVWLEDVPNYVELVIHSEYFRFNFNYYLSFLKKKKKKEKKKKKINAPNSLQNKYSNSQNNLDTCRLTALF